MYTPLTPWVYTVIHTPGGIYTRIHTGWAYTPVYTPGEASTPYIPTREASTPYIPTREAYIPRYTPRETYIPRYTPREAILPGYTPREAILPGYTLGVYYTSLYASLSPVSLLVSKEASQRPKTSQKGDTSVFNVFNSVSFSRFFPFCQECPVTPARRRALEGPKTRFTVGGRLILG